LASYPIFVEPLEPYAGNVPRLLRKYAADVRRAQAITQYVNTTIAADCEGKSSATLSFTDIAEALHMDLQTVKDYLSRYSESDSSVVVEIPAIEQG
jgi:hypothetical protein